MKDLALPPPEFGSWISLLNKVYLYKFMSAGMFSSECIKYGYTSGDLKECTGCGWCIDISKYYLCAGEL